MVIPGDSWCQEIPHVERCPDKSPEIPTETIFLGAPTSPTSPISPETEIPEDPQRQIPRDPIPTVRCLEIPIEIRRVPPKETKGY